MSLPDAAPLRSSAGATIGAPAQTIDFHDA